MRMVFETLCLGICWGRALAVHGRGDRSDGNHEAIGRLRNKALEIGLEPALAAIEDALADR